MKIYNKKGLIWGVFWTIGGLFCLYRDIVDPHDFLPQQIKSVIPVSYTHLTLPTT